MRIIVFGATGSVGKEIVRQGLKQDYLVTAFVRKKSSIEIKDKNLSLFEGDVLKYANVVESLI